MVDWRSSDVERSGWLQRRVDFREEWIAGEESGWLGGVDSWRGEWMVGRSG
jgi:hypothetical protein